MPSIAILWEAGAPPSELDEAALRSALEIFLAGLGHAGSGLTLLLADDGRLRELNRAHRQIDRPTDVLSWSYLGEQPGAPLLGELAISLETAGRQARDNRWTLHTELLRLLAHGCAHLAGYDHRTAAEEREMKAVEVGLLARVGLTGVYPEDAAEE
jgi:probable rRNA maturation factor